MQCIKLKGCKLKASRHTPNSLLNHRSAIAIITDKFVAELGAADIALQNGSHLHFGYKRHVTFVAHVVCFPASMPTRSPLKTHVSIWDANNTHMGLISNTQGNAKGLKLPNILPSFVSIRVASKMLPHENHLPRTMDQDINATFMAGERFCFYDNL